MSILFLVAAGLTAIIAGIHILVGQRTDVAPLLASDLPEPAKSTMVFGWHLISIVLVALLGLFAWSALVPDEKVPAIIATGLCAAFSLWGFAAAALRRRSPVTELPQGLLFALPAVLGAVCLTS